MTHRSRLTAILVDVPHGRHGAAASFWAAALGREGRVTDAYPEFAQLGAVSGPTEFSVQSTGGDAARMHVDIETDDVDAEVARLTALGAAVTGRHRGWVVMTDPAGAVFCVVPVQTPAAFESEATAWT